MRVLVTGANGKVGGATVTALIERGHEVPSTDRQRGVFERLIRARPSTPTPRPT
jgi:nucleoside-diphosphate-sugar epimerase